MNMNPLYPGTTRRASSTPGIQIPTSGAADEILAAGRTAMSRNIRGTGDAIAARAEYITTTELELEEATLLASLREELYNNPDALFTATNEPDEKAIDKLTRKYAGKSEAWAKRFISPVGVQTADIAAQTYSEKVKNIIRAYAHERMRPRAEAAYQARFALASETGDLQGMLVANRNAYNQNLLTDDALALADIRAYRTYTNRAIAAAADFNSAQDLMENADFLSMLTTEQFAHLRSKRDRLARTQSAPPTAVPSVKGKVNVNGVMYEERPSLPPPIASYKLTALWKFHGGDFSKDNPIAQQQAIPLFFEECFKTIPPDNPESTEWDAQMRELATHFGVPENSASSAIAEARAGLTSSAAPNVNAILSAISPNQLTNAALPNAMVIAAGSDENELAELYAEYLPDALKKTFEESGLSPRAFAQAQADAVKSAILAEYSSYIKDRPRATYQDKLTFLNEAITKHSAIEPQKLAETLAPYVAHARAIAAETEAARSARAHEQEKMRIDDAISAAGDAATQRGAFTPSASSRFLQALESPSTCFSLEAGTPLASSLPGSRSNLILYVPAGSPLAAQDNAKIAHGKGAYSVQVEQADVQAPTCSRLLAAHLGLMDSPEEKSIVEFEGMLYIVPRQRQNTPATNNMDDGVDPQGVIDTNAAGLLPDDETPGEEWEPPTGELPLVNSN